MKIEVLDNLEKQMEDFYRSAPNLPKGLSRWLAKWSWLFTLIAGIISALAALGLFAALGIISVFGGVTDTDSWDYTLFAWVALVALLISVYLQFNAVAPLKDMQREGWTILLYIEVFFVVYSLLQRIADGELLRGVLGIALSALIGFYILYQIKPYFKKD